MKTSQTNSPSGLWLIDTFHVLLFGLLLVRGVLLLLPLDRDWQSIAWVWLALLVYSGVLIGAIREVRWCVWFSLLPPTAVFIYTAPNVIFNAWLFASGDPLYLNSPSTIIVVGIMALLLTLPAGAALVMYWRCRQVLFGRAAALPR